jgi:four helix bundle protein
VGSFNSYWLGCGGFLVLASMREAKQSRPYQDLGVEHLSRQLVKDIYQITGKVPFAERVGLTQPMSQAAVSISSHNTEGQFRNSSKAVKQMFSVALGSATAREPQLIMATVARWSRYEESNT